MLPAILLTLLVIAALAYRSRDAQKSHTDIPADAIPFFVGNSLVEGMRQNSEDGYPFFCEVGISLAELNQKLVLPEEYDIAIIEVGSNELGAYSEERFMTEYEKLIEALDCPCFCLSIPPCNEKKSKYADRINNDNVDRYNGYVRQVCENTGAAFIDCGDLFGTELREDWTGDGLHLRASVYASWYRWVLEQIGVTGRQTE